MAQPKRTSADDRAVIVHLMTNGYSARMAAQEIGRDPRTVSRWWHRHNEEGSTSSRHGGGNTRATTERETRAICEYARDKKFITAAAIKSELNLDCSLETIRR